MPLRREAIYLRERSTRLRQIASVSPRSLLSPQLIEMADDLKQRADDLEREPAVAGIRRGRRSKGVS
jgi:hypothetical protein